MKSDPEKKLVKWKIVHMYKKRPTKETYQQTYRKIWEAHYQCK